MFSAVRCWSQGLFEHVFPEKKNILYGLIYFFMFHCVRNTELQQSKLSFLSCHFQYRSSICCHFLQKIRRLINIVQMEYDSIAAKVTFLLLMIYPIPKIERGRCCVCVLQKLGIFIARYYCRNILLVKTFRIISFTNFTFS